VPCAGNEPWAELLEIDDGTNTGRQGIEQAAEELLL